MLLKFLSLPVATIIQRRYSICEMRHCTFWNPNQIFGEMLGPDPDLDSYTMNNPGGVYLQYSINLLIYQPE
jgi:hypothetical protein